MNARPSLATVAALLAACNGGGPALDTRTFELRYLRPAQASALISPYVYADRPQGKGLFSVEGAMVSVRETRDNLDKIARVLAQYDRPKPAVRLTFRLIEADGAATADPSIADVEPTLRKLFRFRGYRVVGDGVVTGLEGGVVSQMIGSDTHTSELHAEIERVVGSGDSAAVLLNVELNLFPGTFRTRVGVPLGKTAVLGNVLGGRARTTLIFTVQPEIVTSSP